MATNADFDALIQRIDTATNTLEEATNIIDSGNEALQQAVIDATEASQTAVQAADEAGTDAQAAQEAYDQADALVTQLEQSVVLDEAPVDGVEYVRKDATWVPNSGGGSGTVQSVNGVTPDGAGEVTLNAANVGALADTYVPAWNDVTGKPSFSTVATSGAYNDLSGTPSIPSSTSDLTNDSGFIGDAPSDGEDYVRRDGAWEVSSSGPYAAKSSSLYDGSSYLDTWVSSNPNVTYPIEYAATRNLIGQFKTGEDIFYDSASNRRLENLTSGKYSFDSSSFTQGPLQNVSGIIEMSESDGGDMYVKAYVNPVGGETEGKVYIWNDVDSEFISVSSGGGGGSSTGYAFTEANVSYDGTPISNWPFSNPHKGMVLGLVTIGSNTGEDIFGSTSEVNAIPEGKYAFTSSTFSSGNLSGKTGMIEVGTIHDGTQKRAWAFVQAPSSGNTEIYGYHGSGVWTPVDS